ncbi:hypothetical protein BHM03_00029050 [Ensete ventricosum]|nr:hypothetical protein BHM03_00029050 [Ensete ventricosum]
MEEIDTRGRLVMPSRKHRYWGAEARRVVGTRGSQRGAAVPSRLPRAGLAADPDMDAGILTVGSSVGPLYYAVDFDLPI